MRIAGLLLVSGRVDEAMGGEWSQRTCWQGAFGWGGVEGRASHSFGSLTGFLPSFMVDLSSMRSWHILALCQASSTFFLLLATLKVIVVCFCFSFTHKTSSNTSFFFTPEKKLFFFAWLGQGGGAFPARGNIICILLFFPPLCAPYRMSFRVYYDMYFRSEVITQTVLMSLESNKHNKPFVCILTSTL